MGGAAVATQKMLKFVTLGKEMPEKRDAASRARDFDEIYREFAARKAAGVSAPGEGRPPFVTGLNRSNRPEIIARALLERGQPVRVVEKVLGANFQRVFAETWRV